MEAAAPPNECRNDWKFAAMGVSWRALLASLVLQGGGRVCGTVQISMLRWQINVPEKDRRKTRNSGRDDPNLDECGRNLMPNSGAESSESVTFGST